MREEIVPGDKSLRVFFIALLLVGAALLIMSPAIGDFAGSYDSTEEPEQLLQRLFLRIRLITAIGALPLLAFAGYFGRAAWRTLRSGAWPPEGLRVPWTLVRRRGAYAVSMGIGNLILAAIFTGHAGWSLWFAWRLAE